MSWGPLSLHVFSVLTARSSSREASAGLALRALTILFRAWAFGLGLRVWGLGLRVQGIGLRV